MTCSDKINNDDVRGGNDGVCSDDDDDHIE